MKVFMVNAVCGSGSTGRIITDLCDILKREGHQVKVAYGVGNASRILPEDTICINNKVGYYWHNALSRFSDRAGFYSAHATKKLIKAIQDFHPDVIHLHNLHGYYLNIRLLFEYLEKADIPVLWTLHDCWAMTGHCAHFSYIHCEKWKDGCHHCPQLTAYPKCYGLDRSAKNYADKKLLFTSVKNMTLITPSKWLADVVRSSFLSKYEVKVIPNGIDLNIFKPTPSDFKDKHRIIGKTMVLAVSNVWIEKKGFSDVCQLSKILEPDKYQVVMVGLTEKQLTTVPNTVLAIQRTASVEELAQIYSAADVFINPSYEETMGMVTAEALACGTPAIVYDRTAVPEIIDKRSGCIVHAGDINQLKSSIEHANKINRTDALVRAQAFEKEKQYGTYMELYRQVSSKPKDKGAIEE